MAFFVLATCLLAAAGSAMGSTAAVYPAGIDPNSCLDYPFCTQRNVPAGYAAVPVAAHSSATPAGSPANFPVPVVNGEPVAPILNTTPEQTHYYQQVKL